MDRRTKFLIYCLEMYKWSESLTGVEVLERFKRYGLFDYTLEFYEILHVHGWPYIRRDLNDYVAERQAAEAGGPG